MPASFDEAWSVASEVEGWLTRSQAEALYDAAKGVDPGGVVVEIGSHRGKSTIVLASALADGVGLTAVDPFDDPRWGGGPESLAVFEANLDRAGVTDRVSLYRGLSEEAASTWQGPAVDLAWIDGAHDEASVLKDIEGWGAHLREGGILMLHDAFSAIGTTRAVLRRLWLTREFRYVRSVRTLVEFRKERRTRVEALADAARLTPRLGFFTRMVAIKLARRRGLDGLERRLMREPNEPLI